MSRRDPPLLFAGELRLLLAVFFFALILLVVVMATHLGAFLMKRLVLLTSIGAAAMLAGCANLPGSTSAGEAVLKDLQGCTRHYEGAIGAGVNGSFKIDCQPLGAAPPPA